MKFNIQVDIDWIDEEYSIDEQVKHELIAGVVREVRGSFNEDGKKAAEEARKKAEQQAEIIISKSIENEIRSFLKDKVTITDKWGEVKKENITIKELIKEGFDKAMDQEVDGSGRPINNSYSSGTTRLKYLLNESVEKYLQSETRRLDKDIENKVKNAINEKLKEGMADSVKKLLNVDKVLNSK